jgi:predicted enzyme related to lactoylglutathione lyase
MSSIEGKFVWYDLMTTDIQAAKDFYTDIVGWKTTQWEGGDYEMWTAAERPIGGIMALSPESKSKGAPPYWLAYVDVADVDATARKAQKLRGKVLVSPTDIPGAGRFAVLADPLGAAFAVFKSPNQQPIDPQTLGHFGWAELNTTDHPSAWKFYSELFNWKHTRSMDMGRELGEYFMFGLEPDKSFGGMCNAATMMNAPPHWIHYVNVRSVDETAKRIPEKGGRVMNGPMDIPGGDRIAQCMDPQGAMFAIYSKGV